MPYRQTLKADAKVPNLFEWNEFFFEFGMEYSKLRRDGEMAELLVDAFGSRYTRVMDLSQNAVDEDMSELTRNLDVCSCVCGLESKRVCLVTVRWVFVFLIVIVRVE